MKNVLMGLALLSRTCNRIHISSLVIWFGTVTQFMQELTKKSVLTLIRSKLNCTNNVLNFRECNCVNMSLLFSVYPTYASPLLRLYMSDVIVRLLSW